MILTVFERMILFNILPKEGNFKTLKTVKALRESLSLSDEENAAYQIDFKEDGKVYWRMTDDDGNAIPQEKDIDIPVSGMAIIKETLDKLDKQNQLKEEHYTVYEKFVEG